MCYKTKLYKISEKYQYFLWNNYITTSMIKRIKTPRSRDTVIRNIKEGKKTYFSNYVKAIMLEGSERESQILECINIYTDKDAIEFKDTFICDELKFSANFDAINWEKQVIYEIKYSKYADDGLYLMRNYEPQIRAQQLAMFLHTGKEYDHKLVACYINPENDRLIYKVHNYPFDMEKVEKTKELIKTFWKEFENDN